MARRVAYRRILVPTDGSARARRAARVAAALARKVHGRLISVCVATDRVPQLRRLVTLQADQALREVQREAKRHRVACEGHHLHGAHAWNSILGAARRHRCDLIVMGSHGRDAMATALLGSETLRVLAHSKVPLLVCR